ncbi:hypothetical protein QCD79_32250, partial [Pseudomonas quasicaspiana]|nr:hypothetical protein [Pseudomonas quasicaspiana]
GDIHHIALRLDGALANVADEGPVAAGFDHPLARPRNRVIKTRGHRTLIGNIRQSAVESEGDVVDVSDALTSKV